MSQTHWVKKKNILVKPHGETTRCGNCLLLILPCNFLIRSSSSNFAVWNSSSMFSINCGFTTSLPITENILVNPSGVETKYKRNLWKNIYLFTFQVSISCIISFRFFTFSLKETNRIRNVQNCWVFCFFLGGGDLLVIW